MKQQELEKEIITLNKENKELKESLYILKNPLAYKAATPKGSPLQSMADMAQFNPSMVPSKPRIIGISGRIGSGKDTVGKIIRYLTDSSIGGFENYEHRFSTWQIKKFAAKMKQCVSIITGIPVESLESIDVKSGLIGDDWGDITYRKLLQLLGTEVGRSIHENAWINALFSEYKKTTLKWDCDGNSTIDAYPAWIITDVRFHNEAEAIKSRGGIMIRLNRNSTVVSEHTSETALDHYAWFDYVIDNSNTTIGELIKMVKEILIIEHIITKD
jgi:ABC-type oligopeptide transport system ATPase subunit